MKNSGAHHANIENRIIRLLYPSSADHFVEHCEVFELIALSELSKAGNPLEHAYFPESGCISLVMEINSNHSLGHSLGIGMVGNEAMVGSEIILGHATPPPWKILVQQSGTCWRISRTDLEKQCTEIPMLGELIKKFILVRLHQQARFTVCLNYHTAASRLARWLLMSSDRCAGSFHVTQQFMALILGVRRVSITNIASRFQSDGMIAYKRGEMMVLNRAALENRACSCYAADRQIYSRIMGTPA